MRRSGQFLFIPRAKFKQREKKVAGYFLFSMAATCVLESQVGFIYKQRKEEDTISHPPLFK
ncbi:MULTISPECIES: hypothetical protein [unclassified Bacillus (in: firmicutes)]|uniref:hypothetical protein n=1 Tax=unclassified Bacillus (in: firmicutes) TaxID=185979 RepID=UPI0008E37294|nr:MULTISPECIES: hypothetical protein [unclassified Bacillus (in: firmicutes)]SFI37044.1 hypothetical protein SAMN04488574_102484 [Bacillus sp. 71mf]SFT11563.1 hypothetical protein SAMN04488145_111125 [Bacillus sp. 103mf]